MHRGLLLGAVCVGLAVGGWAQSQSASSNSDLQRSELSVQVSGVLTHNANNGPTTHLANNSAGLLLGYRVHLSSWEALEVEYGYTRNGQSYFTPATAGGAPATNYAVQANMHQLIFNEVLTTPRIFGFLQPFVLAGGGLIFFRPTSASVIANNQRRGAFNYGGGFDFHIGHLGARAEYQGLIFKVPDFGNPLLAVNKWTHVAQPSVGLVFTF